jgi:hypothetical protein
MALAALQDTAEAADSVVADILDTRRPWYLSDSATKIFDRPNHLIPLMF